MPNNKKKAAKKAQGTSKSTEKDDYKRRNSLTDASLTSSSTSVSSETSNFSSIDSDESGSAAHSGSMTNAEENRKQIQNGEGSSQSVGVEATLVDRTAELSIDPSGNAAKKNVLLVDENNKVPISENTHMKVIKENSGESANKDAKEGSSSPAKASQPKVNNVPAQNNNKKKKYQKERKLTKKEKKEKEINEGKAVGMEAPESKAKLNKKQLELLMKREDPQYQFQNFEEWPTEPSDHMVVKGVNNAAREALGADLVNMPFYGYTRPPTEPIVWLDGHRIGQAKYLKKLPVGRYANSPSEDKLRQRMGFGISATGLHDSNTKMISLNESNHILSDSFDDLVVKTFNIDNWRNTFGANLLNEVYNRESRHKELEFHMRTHVFRMVEDETVAFKKNVMQTVLDCNMEQLLTRIGEMTRVLKRSDVGMRRSGLGQRIPRFDELADFDQMSYCVKLILDWLTSEYLENAPEHVRNASGQQVHVKRGVSVISYLASSNPDEDECFKSGHKKCTMMSFLLDSVDMHTRRKLLVHPFTNSLTPLHFAAMTGWPCQIDILLKFGSSTEMTSDYSKTPLCFAVRRNNTLIARQLMWHGADLSALKRPYNEYWSSAMPTVSNGYSSRKFVDERQAVLNEVFHSWLSAYLAECDDRGIIKVSRIVSDLHQSRIGDTTAEKIIALPHQLAAAVKKVPISLLNTKMCGPVVLFMIPCSYSKEDTTMKSHIPHIVRTSMLHHGAPIAEILQKKRGEFALPESDRKRIVTDVMNHMKPISVLADTPMLIITDGEYEREIPLKPVFEHVHNGLLYAFRIPDIFETLRNDSRITLRFMVSLPVAVELEDNFFMIQACELMSEKRPVTPPSPPELEMQEIETKKPDIVKPEPNKNQSKNAAKKAKKTLKND